MHSWSHLLSGRLLLVPSLTNTNKNTPQGIPRAVVLGTLPVIFEPPCFIATDLYCSTFLNKHVVYSYPDCRFLRYEFEVPLQPLPCLAFINANLFYASSEVSRSHFLSLLYDFLLSASFPRDVTIALLFPTYLRSLYFLLTSMFFPETSS